MGATYDLALPREQDQIPQSASVMPGDGLSAHDDIDIPDGHVREQICTGPLEKEVFR